MSAALAMLPPIKFRPAPLFKGQFLPFKRQPLGGYMVGDLIWLSDFKAPLGKRPGRVINILHSFHVLVIRVENPDRIVEVNPLVHHVMISKRSELCP